MRFYALAAIGGSIGVDVRLLGNVEICGENGVVRLRRSAERCVLATLAFNPGRAVRAVTLADNIWLPDTQSDKAIETVADYVRKVRAAIKKTGGEPSSLRTDRGARAYVLDIEPFRVDYVRFTQLARAGRESGDVAVLEEALALWRGPALADVSGLWAESRRYAVETERLDLYDRVLTEQLRAGHGAEVARTVTALIDEVTPTERLLLLGAQGIAASGHQTAIRSWIDRTTRRMREATGADPSPDLLARLQRLATGAHAGFTPARWPNPGYPRPRQEPRTA